MSLRVPTLLLLLPALLATSLAGQEKDPPITLQQLKELAKARADRQRPVLEKKLEPFLEDLQLSANDSWDRVSAAIEGVATIGSTMVPLLLEKLSPVRGNPQHKNLARNAALTLVRLKPESFVDALMDIAANSKNYAAQGHAIYLIGHSRSENGGALLTRLLDKNKRDGGRRATIIAALTELRYRPAQTRVLQFLPARKTSEHDRVFGFLNAAAGPEINTNLIAILPKVRKSSQILDFIRLLKKTTRGNSTIAAALLPYLKGEKLDRIEMAELCGALAKIAPAGDQATIKALRNLLSQNNTGDLELQAALALRGLGDKQGPKTLLTALKKKLKGAKKRDPYNHSNLGDFYMAFEDLQKAVRSYNKALSYAGGRNLQIMMLIKLARCEARRDRWPLVRKHLAATGHSKKQLLGLGGRYPEIGRAFQQPVLKRYLDSLKR